MNSFFSLFVSEMLIQTIFIRNHKINQFKRLKLNGKHTKDFVKTILIPFKEIIIEFFSLFSKNSIVNVIALDLVV